MWNLPRPGFESVSPTLAGGVQTTGLPGKSKEICFLPNKLVIMMIAGKSDKVFLLHILDFSGMAGQMWEKGMATHSSIFAWRIPWKRSLVGCSP